MKHAWMVALAMLASGAALAQDGTTVNAVSGNVTLPDGSVVAAGNSAAVNGGEVLKIEGSAKVAYSDTCVVDVADTSYTVSDVAPCKVAEAQTPNEHPYKSEGKSVAIGAVALLGLGAAISGGGGSSSGYNTPSSP